MPSPQLGRLIRRIPGIAEAMPGHETQVFPRPVRRARIRVARAPQAPRASEKCKRRTQEKRRSAFPEWELRLLTGGLKEDGDEGRLAKFVILGL
jgi:hypothetical protein